MADRDKTSPDDATRASETRDEAARTDVGRPPTAEEEAAAERAEAQTDLDKVGESYEEYLEIAKDAPGEGQIEP